MMNCVFCVAGVHAVCYCCGWGVARRAWAHVLQHQTCRKKQTGIFCQSIRYTTTLSYIYYPWQKMGAVFLV